MSPISFLQAKYYWHLKKVLHSFTCHYFLEKVLDLWVRRCFFLKISIFGSLIFLTPMFKLLVIIDFPLELKGSGSSVCLEDIIRARLVYNLATFEGRYRTAWRRWWSPKKLQPSIIFNFVVFAFAFYLIDFILFKISFCHVYCDTEIINKCNRLWKDSGRKPRQIETTITKNNPNNIFLRCPVLMK